MKVEEESLAVRPRHIQARAACMGERVWFVSQDSHAIQVPEILRVALILLWTRRHPKGGRDNRIAVCVVFSISKKGFSENSLISLPSDPLFFNSI